MISKIKIFLVLMFYSLILSEDLKVVNINEEISQDSLDLIINELLSDLNKVSDFSLYSHEGELYNMRSLEGKVVLLNFWARSM